MDFGSINWLAVVACVLVSMVVGFLWFGPKTFFPVWWKAIGKSETAGPGTTGSMGMTWGLIVLSSFIQATFMSLMVTALGSTMPGGATLTSSATAGFILWFGFVASTSLANKLFADQLKAWVLEAGNHLVVFVLMGAILGAWR